MSDSRGVIAKLRERSWLIYEPIRAPAAHPEHWTQHAGSLQTALDVGRMQEDELEELAAPLLGDDLYYWWMRLADDELARRDALDPPPPPTDDEIIAMAQAKLLENRLKIEGTRIVELDAGVRA